MLHALPACTQYRPWPGRYYTRALAAARAIGEDYEPELHPIPRDGAAIAASSPHEAKVVLPPGSYLVGLSGSSSEAAGFDVQIRLAGSQQQLCSQRAAHPNLAGGALPTAEGAYNQVFILPKPLVITSPGELIVQLWNKATTANTIQLVLFVAVPRHP